jgi:cytochrome c oxidase subunit 3
MAILATVTMLFSAFTAALLVRRGSPDWIPVALPGVVWASAGVILLSSLALQFSKRSILRADEKASSIWLAVAGALGLLFLVGQVSAWFLLKERGVLLPTSPHAAFFYMLSAVHGAHVIGGLAALAWTLRRSLQGAYSFAMHRGLTQASIYWHYVGAVWIYLLVLLIAV